MATVEADVLAEMPEAIGEGSGRNPSWSPAGASNVPAKREYPNQKYCQLTEAVVERGNMMSALHRVKSNRGSAGVDGMPLSELGSFLKVQWPRIR